MLSSFPMIATSCGVKKKDVETSRLKKIKKIQKPNSESNMQKIKIQRNQTHRS
ncbi:hypothetical protein HYD71_01965 [Mycoplasmopsis bovis]|nr:hypothetical protein [Mycoplasmopsis bovis]QQH49522.1 hypothetical protein HYD71_01965 [Mycoplasmopsis bovis]